MKHTAASILTRARAAFPDATQIIISAHLTDLLGDISTSLALSITKVGDVHSHSLSGLNEELSRLIQIKSAVPHPDVIETIEAQEGK